MDPRDLAYQLGQEMDANERAMQSMERAMDRLIYENRDLREQVVELKLEIERLSNGR